jgi:hypothetical protein
MRRVCFGDSVADRHTIALGAAGWLHLAAAPAFALMALLTSMSGGDMLCGAASPLGGMAPMYFLMSAFHLPPWLKLIARQF